TIDVPEDGEVGKDGNDGKDKNGHADFTIENLADDVIQLAAQLDLNHPHIMGHSMGGSIAQQLCAKYPDSIGKLVLLNTSSKTNMVSIMALQAILNLKANN